MNKNNDVKPKKEEPAAKAQEETREEEKAGCEESTAADIQKDEGSTEGCIQEIERMSQLLADLNDRYLRLAAEYDNFRKRSQKEREAIFPEAYASCANLFLPVLDNLERATNEETADANYKKGIEMIKKQFYDALSKAGITEIEAQGAKFDPGLHNAVQHVVDEALEENVVAEVLQKGFVMGDKVVRHAIVKVAN